MRAFEEFIPQRHDLIGGCLQEFCAELRLELAISVKSIPSEVACFFDLFGSGSAEAWLELLARGGIAGKDGFGLLYSL